MFYLQIQSNINALETLGVAKATFGGLLGSRLIKLIPQNLQAEWVKSATNDATDIESVITIIREQVEAVERLSRMKPEKNKVIHSSTAPQTRHIASS
jgi:hypothetical protein